MHETKLSTPSQLKFSSRPKFETLVSQVDSQGLLHHHLPHGTHGHGHHAPHHHGIGSGFGGGGDGVHGETYELSLLGRHEKSSANSPEPIVDDLTHRTSTRLIAVIDIVYSLIMLIFQLVILIGGSSLRAGGDEMSDEAEAENRKLNLTIGVLIWMGMFAVCIVQVVVAGALYGGTTERDGRKTLRNCRIWCIYSTFLVILLTVEVLGIVASNEIVPFLFPLIVFSTELVFRLIGLIIISRFIKELQYELSDAFEDTNEIHYQQLVPSPQHISSTTANTASTTAPPAPSSASPLTKGIPDVVATGGGGGEIHQSHSPHHQRHHQHQPSTHGHDHRQHPHQQHHHQPPTSHSHQNFNHPTSSPHQQHHPPPRQHHPV